MKCKVCFGKGLLEYEYWEGEKLEKSNMRCICIAGDKYKPLPTVKEVLESGKNLKI